MCDIERYYVHVDNYRPPFRKRGVWLITVFGVEPTEVGSQYIAVRMDLGLEAIHAEEYSPRVADGLRFLLDRECFIPNRRGNVTEFRGQLVIEGLEDERDPDPQQVRIRCKHCGLEYVVT